MIYKSKLDTSETPERIMIVSFIAKARRCKGPTVHPTVVKYKRGMMFRKLVLVTLVTLGKLRCCSASDYINAEAKTKETKRKSRRAEVDKVTNYVKKGLGDTDLLLEYQRHALPELRNYCNRKAKTYRWVHEDGKWIPKSASLDGQYNWKYGSHKPVEEIPDKTWHNRIPGSKEWKILKQKVFREKNKSLYRFDKYFKKVNSGLYKAKVAENYAKSAELGRYALPPLKTGYVWIRVLWTLKSCWSDCMASHAAQSPTCGHWKIVNESQKHFNGGVLSCKPPEWDSRAHEAFLIAPDDPRIEKLMEWRQQRFSKQAAANVFLFDAEADRQETKRFLRSLDGDVERAEQSDAQETLWARVTKFLNPYYVLVVPVCMSAVAGVIWYRRRLSSSEPERQSLSRRSTSKQKGEVSSGDKTSHWTLKGFIILVLFVIAWIMCTCQKPMPREDRDELRLLEENLRA